MSNARHSIASSGRLNRGPGAGHPPGPTGAPTATVVADLITLLRVASIDAGASRLSRSLQEIGSLLERQRADLAALRELVETDRGPVGGVKRNEPQIARGRRERLHGNERAYAELAQTLDRDRADALEMAAELRHRAEQSSEQRHALLAALAPSLSSQYEAVLREGRRPAVASARDGACSACSTTLEPGTATRLRESCRVEPCSGCGRLLYDPGWLERDFRPPTLKPPTRGRP
jgi:hypothetical protein